MKYLFYLLSIATFPAFSQGYVGLGATNKGAQFAAGVLANNIDMSIRYQLPLLSTEIPKILSFNVGHRIKISNYETDNFSITPSIGCAYLKKKDFSLYGTSIEDKILIVEQFKPVFNLEIGKDWYKGRLSFTYTYCSSNYYGVIFKCFLNQ